MAMVTDTKLEKALQKFACDDQYRDNIYGKYSADKGLGSVTNGHVAAYWRTSKPDGTYTIATGDKSTATYPDTRRVLPARGGEPKYRGKVSLPTDAKKDDYALVRIAKALVWVALPDGIYTAPEGLDILAAFDGKYLAAVSALLGPEPCIEVTGSDDPALFSAAPVDNYDDCDLFAIVMPVRVK